MGYTNYTISILDKIDESLISYIKEQLESISDYSFEVENRTIRSIGFINWWDREEKIRVISLFFPEYTILVEGEQQKQGNMWKYYIKNGKVLY